MTLLELIIATNHYNNDCIIKNVQGELKNEARVTWEVECYGHTSQDSGVVDIEDDGEMFMW